MGWQTPDTNGLPRLPAAGFLLVSLAGSCLAGMLLSSLHTFDPGLFMVLAVVLLLGALWLRQSRLYWLVLTMLACLCLGAWRYSISHPNHDPLSIAHCVNSGRVSVQGVVEKEPRLQGYGYTRSLTVAVQRIKLPGQGWREVHGIIDVQTDGMTRVDAFGANYGDSVELTGKLTLPRYSQPGIFAAMNFPQIAVHDNERNPVIGFLYDLRDTLATRATRLLPQPEAALLNAIVLGLRTPALKPLANDFNVTGTAHLVAPSGFKITLFSGLIIAATTRFIGRRKRFELPAERLWSKRRWLVTALVLLSIAGYTMLSGAGAAAIRAGIMGSLLILAPRINRLYNVYTALSLAALIMCLLDPFILWDGGFLLSFLGTLGIVFFTPYLQQLLHPLTRLPAGSYIGEQIAVTLGAQLGTLPVMIIIFQQVSFIAPLANTLTTALLEPLLAIGILVYSSGLLSATLGQPLAWLVWPLLWLMHSSIRLCASIPGAYLTITQIDEAVWAMSWLYYVLLAYSAALLLTRKPLDANAQYNHYQQQRAGKKRWRIVSLILTCVLAGGTFIGIQIAQPEPAFDITFLNVAPHDGPPTGAAILIRTGDNKTVLIDGGSDIVSLGQQLDTRLPPWQRSLDLLVLTSPLPEHITGLLDIVIRYHIGLVIDAGMLHPDTTYAMWRRTISERNLQYQRVVQGQTMPIGTGLTLQVLWPLAILHKSTNEMRDNGLIVRLSAPGFHLLIIGACAQSHYALTGLQQGIPGEQVQADIVYIMALPGQTFGNDLTTLLHKVAPRVVIVGPAALERQSRQQRDPSSLDTPLAQQRIAGIETVRTAQTGALKILSSTGGWTLIHADS